MGFNCWFDFGFGFGFDGIEFLTYCNSNSIMNTC